MVTRLNLSKAMPGSQTYDGVIREASWDKKAWTLVVDIRGGGQRLVQIPVFGSTPYEGDRIQMVGRQPLLGVKINGVDVYGETG